jgi:hypothetical protein
MPPKDIKFDFASVNNLYVKLHGKGSTKDTRGVLRLMYGYELTGDAFEQLFELVSEVLFERTYDIMDDVKTTPADAFPPLREILTPYYGKKLDHVTADPLAWRLAAGRDTMAKGEFLLDVFMPCEPYWTGLRIEDCHHAIPSKEGKPMIELVLRVYDGVFAGLRFSQKIPYKFVIAKLARDIGMPVYQKVHKNELVQCHFAGLIGYDRGPRVSEFHTSPGIRTFNSKIRKERAKPCIKGYKWLCHQCTMGYLRMEDKEDSKLFCPRGTHSMTFKKQACPQCHKEEAWFDPALNSGVCIECKHKTALAVLKVSR